MNRYIDADELIDELDRQMHELEENAEADKDNVFLIGLTHISVTSTINNMPTADVAKIKHGRWLVQDKGIIVTSYRCSECGRVVRDDTGYDVVLDYPYCHCGAKMVNEDEQI